MWQKYFFLLSIFLAFIILAYLKISRELSPIAFGVAFVVIVTLLVLFKIFLDNNEQQMENMALNENVNKNETVAEIAPVGTTQLDGDIPGHLASVNDPSFMTTPSIVLSTTSRGGENLSYKNITTDIRGSIPRVYGGSGSPFNQNIQLEDTNIDPDTY